MTVRLVATPAVGLAALRPAQGVHHRQGAPGRRRSRRGVLRDGRERDRALPPDPVGEGPADRPAITSRTTGGGWTGNHAAQVIQRVVPAAGTQQLLLERGDAHLVVLASIGITPGPEGAGSQAGREDGGDPAFRVTVISMNTQKGPLKDVRLRKALQAAFDYEGMVQVYKGYAEIPNSPIPKGFTAAYEPETAAVQARRGAGQAAPRRGGVSGQAAHPVRSSTPRPSRRRGWPGSSCSRRSRSSGITLQPRGEAASPRWRPRSPTWRPRRDIQATLTMTPRGRRDPGELLRTLYSAATPASPSTTLGTRARTWTDSSREADRHLRRRQAHGALSRGGAEAHRRRAIDLGRRTRSSSR